ncbi:MAG: sigma-54-dependent transcriptional regulator [Candidatus Electronema sp. V4]|uniref:sigma-54-dependent transcriptional regulator n=1 Tax=Candidatus Electronema sp. V4 TaxID=3454756 RepID=UPI0040553AD8
MTEAALVLVIDDEENMRHMLSALLRAEGYAVETAAHGRAGLERLRQGGLDFILCDIRMPEMDGLAFLHAAAALRHSAVIIMMSAFGTVDTAIEAMKQGAYDFISKPFKTDEVVLVLKKAEERERLRRETILLKKRLAVLEQAAGLGGMIGRSKAMQAVFQLADKVARHSTTVLITGESGTGKELVARGIHEKSGRAAKPFLAVNCGGIPENLLESEFFGHVRGAFTGAERDRKGLFEEADGGTLFLDEIGELPLSMQVKLLRAVQEQEIRRVGASASRKVDVRLIAATARNLVDEVRAGRFREDLFYRLNVVNIHLPPLRERIADIPLLCDYFIEKFALSMKRPEIEGIAPAALQRLLAHSWPGNVRELENVLERAVLLAEEHLIQPDSLPEMLTGHREGHPLALLAGVSSIKKGRQIVEQWLIARAMEATGGNKSRAAELLEISYPSLLSKLKQPESDDSSTDEV